MQCEKRSRFHFGPLSTTNENNYIYFNDARTYPFIYIVFFIGFQAIGTFFLKIFIYKQYFIEIFVFQLLVHVIRLI